MASNEALSFAARLIGCGHERAAESAGDALEGDLATQHALNLIGLAETISRLSQAERLLVGELVAWNEHHESDVRYQ